MLTQRQGDCHHTLALVGGDIASVNYTDLMNGPMDRGMSSCPSYNLLFKGYYVSKYFKNLMIAALTVYF